MLHEILMQKMPEKLVWKWFDFIFGTIKNTDFLSKDNFMDIFHVLPKTWGYSIYHSYLYAHENCLNVEKIYNLPFILSKINPWAIQGIKYGYIYNLVNFLILYGMKRHKILEHLVWKWLDIILFVKIENTFSIQGQ